MIPRDGLVAHDLDGLRLGPDELDVARFALLGELAVFGKKAVSRMDGVDVGDFGRADDAIGAQVAVGALGAADADGLVGQLHVERLDVGLGIDRQGLDAQFAAGADDAKGDFAAISDEDLLNHGQKGRPYSSAMPPVDQCWFRERDGRLPINPA